MKIFYEIQSVITFNFYNSNPSLIQTWFKIMHCVIVILFQLNIRKVTVAHFSKIVTVSYIIITKRMQEDQWCQTMEIYLELFPHKS